MVNCLQNSLFWRFLLRIAVFFSAQVRESAILGGIRLTWRHAATRRFLVACGDSDEPMLHSSLLWRCFAACRKGLAHWHAAGVCLRESFLGRFGCGLLRWGQNSRILGWLFRDGFTGVLLVILGLYGGIDWLLRDVLPIPLLSSTWDELLLIVTLLWIVWQRTDRREIIGSRATSLDVFVAIFLMIGLMLMVYVGPSLSIAISGYRAVCQYILWFYVVTRLLRDDEDLKRLYAATLVLASLIALHGIYQYIVAVPIPEHWTDQAEAGVRTRVFSIFGSPNIMADYMVMFAPMCAGLAYYTKNKLLKLVAWFFTFCMCLSCLFTMSRGGWVAMAVAILIFAVLVDRRLLLVMLAAAVASLFLPFVASRLGYLFTDDFARSTANGGRGSRWAIGLTYLRNSSPTFGFGLGMFGGAVAMQNKFFSHISYFYIDNYYLKTLVEMGAIGFGAFVLMQVGMLITGMRSLYRAAKSRLYPLTAGIFSGMCGVLVHLYFENIFEEPYMLAYFWILAAMMVYMGFFRRNEVSQ